MMAAWNTVHVKKQQIVIELSRTLSLSECPAKTLHLKNSKS